MARNDDRTRTLQATDELRKHRLEVMGGSHPGELLDHYSGQLRIMGGVDKIQLGSGREAIRKYLDTLVPYVEKGGYIPFCDHRCPPNVPEDAYIFYLDLKKKMFGM